MPNIVAQLPSSWQLHDGPYSLYYSKLWADITAYYWLTPRPNLGSRQLLGERMILRF